MFEHKSRNPVTRREALRRVGNGFGMMAFAGMLNRSLVAADAVGSRRPENREAALRRMERSGWTASRPANSRCTTCGSASASCRRMP